jgi:alpha-L-fucosidase
MVVANSLASVPAWAPLGEDPLWYRHHLGEAHGSESTPLAEVLAHHRDRWDHLDGYDDFARLVSFDDDAPERWVRLAADAGMALSASTAKHHDGWCWWNAPATDRVLTTDEPHSGTLSEHAAACERRQLAFGAIYSTLDWPDAEAGSAAHLGAVMTPQLAHLVGDERPHLVWLRGTVAPHAQEALVRTVLDTDPDVTVFSDAPLPGATRVRSTMPDGIEESPWVLCRGVGASLGFNRAETNRHQLTARGVIALYTEALAKGGALTLSVGTDAGGDIAEEQAAPLRVAGEWILAHAHLLDHSMPWKLWGDSETRLLADPGDTSSLLAVDLTGAGRFATLTPDVVDVLGVVPATATDDSAPPVVTQDASGLVIDSGHELAPVVWRLKVSAPTRPAALFPHTGDASIDISELLANAAPGEIVQLGEGAHHGRVSIPDRVTLRGLGPERTTLRVGDAVEIGRRSRLEHVAVESEDDLAFDSSPTLVTLVGERGRLLGCRVEGTAEVRSDDTAVRGSHLRGVRTKGADRLSLAHATLVGRAGDVAVQLRGGGEHLVDSCEIRGHDGGIHASDTTGTRIRGCDIAARQFGVRLSHTEDARVRGNQFHGISRAVDVVAGTQASVEGNAVFDGDSGCVVQAGATDAHVSGNRWERCRIGLLAWNSSVVEEHDNSVIDLADPDGASVVGP